MSASSIIMSNNGSSGTNTNTSGSNYGGKKANTSADVKQFISTTSSVSWIYKTIQSIKYITPATKNDVYLPQNATVVGNLTVDGIIINPSDISLKENIINLTDIFCDNILKIVPKIYNYKKDENKKKRYGIIAQELEEYFPELVINQPYIYDNYDDDDNDDDNDNENCNEYDKCGIINSKIIKSVNYLELIPIIIVKMKKMQTEIDELKSEINSLKTE
jgi:hypothetical protein